MGGGYLENGDHESDGKGIYGKKNGIRSKENVPRKEKKSSRRPLWPLVVQMYFKHSGSRA